MSRIEKVIVLALRLLQYSVRPLIVYGMFCSIIRGVTKSNTLYLSLLRNYFISFYFSLSSFDVILIINLSIIPLLNYYSEINNIMK